MGSNLQTKSATSYPGPSGSGDGKQARRLAFSTELVLLIIIIGIVIAMSMVTDTFISTYNITNIFPQASIVGIIAISSTFVIISGGIDLSVAFLPC
jgi:ribose transport system permease protein